MSNFAAKIQLQDGRSAHTAAKYNRTGGIF